MNNNNNNNNNNKLKTDNISCIMAQSDDSVNEHSTTSNNIP